jgi:hypothetical protein
VKNASKGPLKRSWKEKERRGSSERTYDLDDGSTVHSLADAAELELGRCLDGHDVVSLEEVKGHVGNVGSGHHHIHSCIGNCLDDLFQKKKKKKN